jgi:hypothetical protein
MRIGIYLGSFAPMHKGHEQALFQATALNDVLLFFPGFGPKGVKQGTKTMTIDGQKQKFKKYSRVSDQVMMTPEIKKQQFNRFKIAISQLPDNHPMKSKPPIIIFPGEIIDNYEASAGPISNVYAIVDSLTKHYHDFNGNMTGVYIPFLSPQKSFTGKEYGLIDNPEVRLYSDISDTFRASPNMLKRALGSIKEGLVSPDVIDELFSKKIFVLSGIKRGETPQLDYPIEEVEFETEQVSGTQLRKMIYSLRNIVDDNEYEEAISAIVELMPSSIGAEERKNYINAINQIDKERERRFSTDKKYTLLKKDLPDDFVYEAVKKNILNEVNSISELIGTEDYSIRIDELINQLQDIKGSLASRKKANQRYRKESSSLQNAISSLRYLKRKNQRTLSSNNINENFSRDNIKNFIRKLKE